ncbi:beta-cystathionase [Allorhodopirellula solitaria]|uniref:Flagellar MS-ring protein n=1 Tax=Allorhodopirellula solitaria TaxID=2527987 RepID=A0A5C5YKB7_9BACT|nr:beta-cystathionase [Allorhodopirellula solitaria]TWT75356.1 flagellar MS-ring protein [Allorhodopirellula solitaria]
MLPKSLEQFRDVFSAMPVQSRVIAVLLVAAMVMAFGFLIRGSGSPDTEYLLGGKLLDENDLDAAEMAFGSAHLTGWKRDGRRMLIPTAQRSEFLAALESSAALPTSLRSHIQEAIDSSTPFESSEQRSARVSHAKERDLSDDIAKFPDVRSANVTYDEGERIGLGRGRKQSASVFVQPEGGEPLSQARVEMIRKMIRASFAGMSIEDVEVTDANASAMAHGYESDDPLSRKRREEEAYYEQKIRSQLAGYGQIHVKTFADIDPSMGVEKARIKYDSQPTTLTKTRRKVETGSTRPRSGGGLGAQISALITSNRSVKLDSVEHTSTTQLDETSTDHIAGQEYEATRTAALAVKRIRVSIGLPSSYYRKVHCQNFLQNNPGTNLDDIDSLTSTKLQELRDCTKLAIESAVLPLLPDVAPGSDSASLVKVWDYPDLPEQLAPAATNRDALLTWLAGSWQMIAVISLATMALLIARGAIQSRGHAGDPNNRSQNAALDASSSPADTIEPSEPRFQHPAPGGNSALTSELAELVEQNPRLAANVLQSWVGEAA